jgi:hypothetical protein
VRRKIIAPTGNGNLVILLVASYFTDCASGLPKVIMPVILTTEQ